MIGQFDENRSFEYENGFFLTSEIYRLGNIMAHFELYKKILNMPGDIVELGVFKGSSIIQWATFRELLENEKSRKIIGFDAFGEFPQDENESDADKSFIDKWNDKFKDEFVKKEDIEESLKKKGITNVELIKGDVNDTLPNYVKNNSKMRIALLHLDMDVYKPTLLGLECLYDMVLPGGVIVIDDYTTVDGATKAVDEFYSVRKLLFEPKKYSFSHSKPTFVIKKV